MGDNFQVLEILVFAVIAGILVFRLRSVLGRRTGHERRRDLPFASPPAAAKTAPTLVALPQQPRPAIAGADPALAPLVSADPAFDAAAFLKGAGGAFEIVVQAFAAGDRDKLRPLLSPEVFASFAAAIDARARAGEKQETRIVALKGAEIAAARVQGDTALVTVKFVSDQIMATRDRAGAVIEGDPDRAVEHTDLWTFSRPIRSADPNWILIATETPQP